MKSILKNIFLNNKINILNTKSPGKRKKKSSVRLCMFFLGWAGLGEVRPKINVAGGAPVSSNLKYS